MPLESHRYTADAYLRLEEIAVDRHEFRDGGIVDMPDGTFEHTLTHSNVIRALGNRFNNGRLCRVAESNLRVRIGMFFPYISWV